MQNFNPEPCHPGRIDCDGRDDTIAESVGTIIREKQISKRALIAGRNCQL